eukprot:5574985-Lingulodinium_polyedra.AAC.1
MVVAAWIAVYAVFAVAIVVAPVLMPHTRSAVAAARRLERAIVRHYIQPVPAGDKLVAVPAVAARRVKTMARGLIATKDMEERLGQHRRSTAELAALARESLSGPE